MGSLSFINLWFHLLIWTIRDYWCEFGNVEFQRTKTRTKWACKVKVLTWFLVLHNLYSNDLLQKSRDLIGPPPNFCITWSVESFIWVTFSLLLNCVVAWSLMSAPFESLGEVWLCPASGGFTYPTPSFYTGRDKGEFYWPVLCPLSVGLYVHCLWFRLLWNIFVFLCFLRVLSGDFHYRTFSD